MQTRLRGSWVGVLLGACSMQGLVGCGDDDSACEDGTCSAGSTATSSSSSTSAGSGGAGGGEPGLVCPPSGVLHGPWTQKPTETSIVVRWNACAEGDPTVVVETGAGARTVNGTQTAAEVTTEYFGLPGATLPDYAGTYWLNEVVIEDLEPGACTTYAIASEPERGGRFCTARSSGDAFSFWAIGDTNPGIGPTEEIVSEVTALSPDFALHLGDIQYYSSIVDSWNQWFLSMQPMLSSGAFEPTFGNHEAEEPTEFEDYYLRLFADGGFEGSATWYRFASGGVHFFALDTEADLSIGSEQGGWLEAELATVAEEPGYRGAVVYMHRPFLSVGDGGSRPELRAHYEPIFEERGVRLVLAGHMHGYERFLSGNVTYVVSGGGGGLLGDVDEGVAAHPEDAALRQFAAAAFHAVHVEVDAEGLSGSAIDERGEAIDTFAIPLLAP